MFRPVVASAPGKVVLCGEYAVMGGAPAVCMAVNRRARAIVSVIDGDTHRVSAPAYSTVEGRFAAEGGEIEWLKGEDEFKLVDAVWRTLANRPSVHGDHVSLSIELDTRAFVDSASGLKIGIGSSAALTVALSAALSQSSDVLGSVARAHRRFQGGAGSGIDVATAVHGGMIEYRMAESVVSSLQWPAGLAYRLIWTGVPASTRMKLEKLAESGQCSSKEMLAKASERMAKAWASASAVLQQFPAYIETLRQFSVDHELGIFDAGHDHLVSEAAAAGLVYKPCGAGGGDIGILLGSREAMLDDFIMGSKIAAQQVPGCRLEHDGVLLEWS